MRCFYHRERDAIGTCKACCKGLCKVCAVDVTNGLACRDQCEEQVRSINSLVDRNTRLSPVSEQLVAGYRNRLLMAGVFTIFAGLLFVMLGLPLQGTGRFGVTGIGVLVILGGVVQLALAWRMKSAPVQRGQ